MTLLRSLFADRQHLLLLVVGGFFLVLTFIIFSPFLMPIALAATFSFGLGPVVDRLQGKSRRTRWITAAYVLIGLTLFFGVLSHAVQRAYSLLFGPDRESAMGVLIALKEKVTLSIEALIPFARDFNFTFPGFSYNFESMKSLVESNVEKLLALTAGGIATTLASLPETLLYVFTFLIFLSLFVIKRKYIHYNFSRANLVNDDDLNSITRWAQESSFLMIYVNVVVGSIQALILTLASYWAGFPEWSLIFALVFCASFFPLLGTAPISVVLILLAYSTLGTSGTIILAVAGLLTGVVDNVLRSYLVSSKEEGINSWVTLIGILGAIGVFGFAGIFLGPFILSFLVKIWPRLNKVVADSDNAIQIVK